MLLWFQMICKCLHNMHDWILWHGNYHGYAVSTSLSFPMLGRMAWAGKNMDFRMITFCYMSVCLSSVTFVRPTQAIKISAMFLRHLVRWPSADIHNYWPWMILNGVMVVTLCYFTEFCKPSLQKTICGGIYAKVYCILVRVQCRHKESSRSLSHLLMSFL